MTTEINIHCDGRNCHRSIEIPTDNDEHIKKRGWAVDDGGLTHYCPECWKEIQQEMRHNQKKEL